MFRGEEAVIGQRPERRAATIPLRGSTSWIGAVGPRLDFRGSVAKKDSDGWRGVASKQRLLGEQDARISMLSS